MWSATVWAERLRASAISGFVRPRATGSRLRAREGSLRGPRGAPLRRVGPSGFDHDRDPVPGGIRLRAVESDPGRPAGHRDQVPPPASPRPERARRRRAPGRRWGARPVRGRCSVGQGGEQREGRRGEELDLSAGIEHEQSGRLVPATGGRHRSAASRGCPGRSPGDSGEGVDASRWEKAPLTSRRATWTAPQTRPRRTNAARSSWGIPEGSSRTAVPGVPLRLARVACVEDADRDPPGRELRERVAVVADVLAADQHSPAAATLSGVKMPRSTSSAGSSLVSRRV